MNRIACFFLATFLFIPFSQAQFSLGGPSNVTLELSVDKTTVKPGDTVNAVLKMTHGPGWNSYWTNPGTGSPTSLTWTLPEGFQTGTPLWPIPKVKDSEFGTNHIYVGSIDVVTPITVPANATAGEMTIDLSAGWLECDIKGCMPRTGEASVKLMVADSSAADEAVSKRVAAVAAQQPKSLAAWNIEIGGTEESFEATLTPAGGANSDPGDIYFFESTGSPQLEYKMPTVAKEGDSIHFKMARSGPDPVEGFFYAPNGWDGSDKKVKALSIGAGPTDVAASTDAAVDKPVAKVDEAVSSSAASGEASDAKQQAAIKEMRSWGVVELDSVEKKEGTVGLMILFAFLGGMILNVMPCVFPVLGLKIMGFVQQAGDDKAKIKKHGLVFASGVLASLWVLVAVLLIVRVVGGQNVAWGFQLQNPLFVAFMIAVMFIFGLNLSGLFELGTSLTSAGSSLQMKEGYSGSFFSGVLAVLVASPCTGPFMGPAIAFALGASTITAFLIFTALALGLALPYVLLSFFPALIQKLPKPGAWMETFKQFMAFPLYATAIWLIWVFGKVTGASGMAFLLFGLLIASFGMWLYGRYATLMAKPLSKWIGRFAAIGGVVGLALMASKGAKLEAPSLASGAVIEKYGMNWEVYSPANVVEHRKKGRTVFIDFTADW